MYRHIIKSKACTKNFARALFTLLAGTPCLVFSNQSTVNNAFVDEEVLVTGWPAPHLIAESILSVSVVNENKIENVGAEHANQLFARTSGTWISRGNGQEHLTAIRSPVLTGAGSCGAFFIAQDDISARAPNFCNANQLFDLNLEQAASAEIIKGSSSVAHGSNAVHGSINITTKDARNQRPFSLGIDSGPNNFTRAKFLFSQSTYNVLDNAFLIYGNVTSDGGYKNDSGFDQQKLTAIYQTHYANMDIKNVFSFSNLNQETSGFIQGENSFKDDSLKRVNPNPEAFRDARSARAYSQINIDLQNGGSASIKPYIRWSNMAFLQHFLPWQALEKNSQFSLGAQSKFRKSLVNSEWLVGLDIDTTGGQLLETQAEPFSPTIPAGAHYDYKVNAQTISPFTMLTYSPLDKMKLQFGARFDHVHMDYNNLLPDGSACAQDVDNCRFTRPQDQNRAFSDFSYHAGFNFEVFESMNIYSNLASGFRSPQTTELFRLQAGQVSANLDSEQSTSVDIGLRGDVITSEKLTFGYDAALYRLNKKNVIFQDSARQNISEGKTSHTGLDATLFLRAKNGIYASTNLSSSKHTYDNNISIVTTNIIGNDIDSAPRFLGSLQFGWRGNSKNRIEIEAVSVGKYFLNPENTARYEGHTLMNVRAQYQLSRQASVGIRIINLGNTNYAERADFGFGNYRYFVGEPRSVYASVNFALK